MTVSEFRAAASNPRRFEVLVDTAACIRGGNPTWCKVKKLGAPTARFGVVVWLPDGIGAGSFRDSEVLDVRPYERAAVAA